MSRRLLPLLLAVAGCHPLGSFVPPDDTGEGGGSERIAVTPAELSFGTISVNAGGVAVARYTIYNLGDDAITVSGQDEVLGSDVFTADAPPLHTLDAGASLEVEVLFVPRTEGSYEADILVQPGLEAVRLVGASTAPVARVGEVDFAPVVLGCSGIGSVTLTNDGSEPLRLDDPKVSTTEFAVVDAPAELAPGEAGSLLVSFTPEGGGQRGATLTVTTNDPLLTTLAVPLSVLGYEGERVREVFRYAPSNPTDILFVVETSAALQPRLADAGDALAAFVEDIRSTNVDYHLVSVSSGEVCPAASRAWSTRSDTSLQTAAVLDRGFTGPSGAWDDDLLGLALLALASTDPGECLEGYRRPEADLHVIVVTDGPSREDVSAQVTTLAAGLGADTTLRVSGLLPVGAAECGEGALDLEAAIRTTGGTLGDLCAADWVPAFEELATLPPGADPVRYPLAEVPVPSTLTVEVEGQPFALWTYDGADNAVVFDGDAVPALGAEVAVEYVLAVACEG